MPIIEYGVYGGCSRRLCVSKTTHLTELDVVPPLSNAAQVPGTVQLPSGFVALRPLSSPMGRIVSSSCAPMSCVCAGFNPNGNQLGAACWNKSCDDPSPNADCSSTTGTQEGTPAAFFAGGSCFRREWTELYRNLTMDKNGLLRDSLFPVCRSVPCDAPRPYSFGSSAQWDLETPGSDFWRLGLSMWALRQLDKSDGSVCLQNVGTLHYLGVTDIPDPTEFSPMPTTGHNDTELLNAGEAPFYPGSYESTDASKYCRANEKGSCPGAGALRVPLKAKMFALPPYARRVKWEHYKSGAVRWIPIRGLTVHGVSGVRFKNVKTGEMLQIADMNPFYGLMTTGASTTFPGGSFYLEYIPFGLLPSGRCAPCGTPLSLGENSEYQRALARGIMMQPRYITVPTLEETTHRWAVRVDWSRLGAPTASTAPALLELNPVPYKTGTTGKQDIMGAIAQAASFPTLSEIMKALNSKEVKAANAYNDRIEAAASSIADYINYVTGRIDPDTPPAFFADPVEAGKLFGFGPKPGTMLLFAFWTYMRSLVRAFSDCYASDEVPDSREAAIAWGTDQFAKTIHSVPIDAVPYPRPGFNHIRTAMITESITRDLNTDLYTGPGCLDGTRMIRGAEWVAGSVENTLTLQWARPVAISRIAARLYTHPSVCLYGQDACEIEIQASLKGVNVNVTGDGRTAVQFVNTDGTVSPMPLWYDALSCEWFFQNTVCATTWKCPRQADPSLLSWWMFPQIGQGRGAKNPQQHPSKGPPNWGPPSTGVQQQEFSQGSFYGYICRTIEGSVPAWLMASNNNNPRHPSRNCPGQQPSPPPPCCEIPGGDVYVIAETENKIVANFAPCHWWMRPDIRSGDAQWYRLLTITDADCDPHEPTNKKCYYVDQPLGPTTAWMALTLRDEATVRPGGAQSIVNPPKFVGPNGTYFSADVFPWVLSSPATTSSNRPAKSPLTCQWLGWKEQASDRQLFRWIDGSPQFPNCRILECKAFPFRPLDAPASLPSPGVQTLWQSNAGARDIGVDKVTIKFTPRLGENPIGTAIPPLRVRSLSVAAGCPAVLGYKGKIGIDKDASGKTKFFWPYQTDGIGSLYSNSVKVHTDHSPEDNHADSTYVAKMADVGRSELRRLGGQGSKFQCVQDCVIDDDEEDFDTIVGAAQGAGAAAAAGVTPALPPPAPIPPAAGVTNMTLHGPAMDQGGGQEGAPNAVVPGMVAAAAPANVVVALNAVANVPAPVQGQLVAAAEGNATLAAIATEGNNVAGQNPAQLAALAGHAVQLEAAPGAYAPPNANAHIYIPPDPVNPRGTANEAGGARQGPVDTILNFFSVSLASMFGSIDDVAAGGGAAAAPGAAGATVNGDAAWSVIVQLTIFAGMAANGYSVAVGLLNEMRDILREVIRRIRAYNPTMTVAQVHAMLGGLNNALPFTNFTTDPNVLTPHTAPGLAAGGHPLTAAMEAAPAGGAAAAAPAGGSFVNYIDDIESALAANINYAVQQYDIWKNILSFLMAVVSNAAFAAKPPDPPAGEEPGPGRSPTPAQVLAALQLVEGAIRRNAPLPLPEGAAGIDDGLEEHWFDVNDTEEDIVYNPNTYMDSTDRDWRLQYLGIDTTDDTYNTKINSNLHGGMYRYPVYGDRYGFIQWEDYAEGVREEHEDRRLTPAKMTEALAGVQLSGLMAQGGGAFASPPAAGAPPPPVNAVPGGPMARTIQDLLSIAEWINNNGQNFLGHPYNPNQQTPIMPQSLGMLNFMMVTFQSAAMNTNAFDGVQLQMTNPPPAWTGMIRPDLIPGLPRGHAYAPAQLTPPPFLSILAGSWYDHIVNGIYRLYRTPAPDSFFSALAPGHGDMPVEGATAFDGLLSFLLSLAGNTASPWHTGGGS